MAHLRGALLLLLATGAACAPASPTPQPSMAPLEVEYAGCKAVLIPGPVCVLDPSRKLQLWVGAPPGVEIQADGRKIDTTAESIGNGQGFSLILPSGTKRVDVLVATREDQEPWSLSLAEPEGERTRDDPVRNARQAMPRDVLREIDEETLRGYECIRKRNLAGAREIFANLQLPPKLPAESRLLVSYNWGLLAEKEGNYRLALAEIQKTVEIAGRVKLDDKKRLAEEQMALVLRGVGRSRAAAHIFERLRRTLDPKNTCAMGRFLNNQAWSTLLAREAGERLEDPTPLLEKALVAYETCKKVSLERKVNVLINLVLAHLQEGRLSQAKDLLTQVHQLEPRASLPHTLWRLDLEARIELRDVRSSQALHLFKELEDLAQETRSPDGRVRAAFGQAQSHQALGEPEAALATLRRIEAQLDEQSLQIPVNQGRETFVATRQAAVGLHIEILLDQGQNAQAFAVARHARSRMLRQLERSDRLASLSPDRRAQWDRLLAEYQEKRTALEERAKEDWRLPGDQLSHEWGARKAEAEAAQKLLDKAFQVLGHAGEQPEDGLTPPRPGELILAYHPLAHGWVGFAAHGKTIDVHRFELPPEVLSRPEELAQRLLLPFRPSIEKARKIRFLPSGPLQEVDFHELPFNGDILLASAPVVYGLDLPVAAGSARAPGRRALLVADPRGDLPGALNEGRTVLKFLKSGSQPWLAEELSGTDASAGTVRDRLTAADLLHYAGHSSYSGFGGWESSLLLADETQLTLGDLLTLKRVPTWVVLSGCDTGKSSSETSVESLGLAHAFLLAGSKAAIASTRPAFDRAVPDLFAELYRQWDREPDLALAFQRAQLSWRKQNPGVDWAGFRLFEP
ncbi:MAG TPA: CHAT domain-containing protein [Thermoanaerobaculia bacterium]|nr:CHAT domain-containing protein [Thermoanaerobaculia bacterium]